MLTTIREFFERHLAPGQQSEGEKEHALKLATAALLMEMTRMDHEVLDAERQRVELAVRGKFGLSEEEGRALVELAEQELDSATDYHQFTSLINRHFTPEQKQRMIELLWEVAYADGELDTYEEHLVRKIAELLYVPHHAFIAAKLKSKPQ